MLTSVRTVAPTAAGLKMWRPRHASTYFDSEATAAASAMPASPARSSVGRRTNSRMCAVISEDSIRHGSFRTAGRRHPLPRTRRTRTDEGDDELERSGGDQLEERDGEARRRASAASARQRQPVHRDTAEHREDAVPQRSEGSDHVNNSAVLPGDHSTRPSVVIRTHSTPHSWASSRSAVEEQRGRDRVRAHRGRRDRPRRGDRAHRLPGARIEHVVQAVPPGAAVRRRGAERGIRHLDDADRATRVVRMLQPDALCRTAHREIAARVDDDVADRDGGDERSAPGRRAAPCRAHRHRSGRVR